MVVGRGGGGGRRGFLISGVALAICSTKVTKAFLLHPLRGNKKSSYLTEDGYLMEPDKRFENIPRGILKKNVKREPENEVQEVCVEMKEEAATGTNKLTFFLLFFSKIAFYDEKMYSGKNGLQPSLMTLWTQNIYLITLETLADNCLVNVILLHAFFLS